MALKIRRKKVVLGPGPGIDRYFLTEETYNWGQFCVTGRGEGC